MHVRSYPLDKLYPSSRSSVVHGHAIMLVSCYGYGEGIIDCWILCIQLQICGM